MIKNLKAMYFSPTDKTKRVVTGIAKSISQSMDTSVKEIDFTLKDARMEPTVFSAEDFVVFGVPVYAGRVPNILLKYLNTIQGNGAVAAAIVVYGNRNYDDALIELRDILETQGFQVIAGGAFVGEHSFSTTLAKSRPDEKDMSIVGEFASKIYNKLATQDQLESIDVKGNRPYRKYYVPKDKHGEPADIRKVTPKTNSDCIDCKICVGVCPMSSIDYDDVFQMVGICIKCGACIKKCPTHAKYYDDENFLKHKHELEDELTFRREPELFL